jgi:hypothetical protein
MLQGHKKIVQRCNTKSVQANKDSSKLAALAKLPKLVQSTDQEKSPARNAIYAHAQDFAVSDDPS